MAQQQYWPWARLRGRDPQVKASRSLVPMRDLWYPMVKATIQQTCCSTFIWWMCYTYIYWNHEHLSINECLWNTLKRNEQKCCQCMNLEHGFNENQGFIQKDLKVHFTEWTFSSLPIQWNDLTFAWNQWICSGHVFRLLPRYQYGSGPCGLSEVLRIHQAQCHLVQNLRKSLQIIGFLCHLAKASIIYCKGHLIPFFLKRWSFSKIPDVVFFPQPFEVKHVNAEQKIIKVWTLDLGELTETDLPRRKLSGHGEKQTLPGALYAESGYVQGSWERFVDF